MADMLIIGGSVLDGDGGPARPGDIRIAGGVITEIAAELTPHPGESLFDATGYLVTPGFVDAWRDRMVNIHPSLLPAFKGLHPQQQALDAGVRVSGCTVHFVRNEMDAGPILVQGVVPVLPDDTADILADRILAAEHAAYPLAVRLIAEGRVRVADERVAITGGDWRVGALMVPAAGA